MRMLSLVAAGLVAAPAVARAQFLEPDVKVLHTLAGDTTGEFFGWAVSELADIDDDGVTDVIVGAPFASDVAPSGGRAYVYSGRTGRLIYKLQGGDGEQMGFAIADAGDIDRDGVHDILVGAPALGPGHVYIFSGRNGSLIDMVEGETDGDFFGFSVAGIGDADGDHRPDFVVGAARASELEFQRGRAYVYSGRHRTLLHRLDGEVIGDLFGSGIAGVGDLDGDGRGDFIVGARNAGPVGNGLAYVFSGATALPIFPTLQPEATGRDFGWFFVATPGDVNGDGIPDLYVGDTTDVGAGPFSGRAYVFSGKDAHTLYELPGERGAGAGCGRGARDVNGDRHADVIVGSYTSFDGAPFAGQMNVYSGCDGSLLRTVTSTSAGEQFGFDAVGVGDLDGDREADFMVSAAAGDRVYLIAGAKTCIADFDRNGRIDTRDAVAYLLAFAARSPRADTNCDGRIDLRDYLTFLGAVLFGCG